MSRLFLCLSSLCYCTVTSLLHSLEINTLTCRSDAPWCTWVTHSLVSWLYSSFDSVFLLGLWHLSLGSSLHKDKSLTHHCSRLWNFLLKSLDDKCYIRVSLPFTWFYLQAIWRSQDDALFGFLVVKLIWQRLA